MHHRRTQSTEPLSAAASTPSPSLRHPSTLALQLIKPVTALAVRLVSGNPDTDRPSLRPSLFAVVNLRINHGPPPSWHLSTLSIVLTITQGANQSGLGGGPPGQGGDNKDKKDSKVTSPPATFL